MNISDEEWGHALREMHAAGLTHGPDNPEGHLETGHWLTVVPPGEVTDGQGVAAHQWGIEVKHPGDPTGSWLHATLGPSHEGIGQRALRTLGQPDVMKEMRAQLDRAAQDGKTDPGFRGPGRFGPDGTWFYHYR